MPHGAPDDSDVVKVGDAYRLDDMAELAARLGSPVTFNRMGDVVWMDTFAGGVNGWKESITGTDIAIEIRNTHFLTDGLACAIETNEAYPANGTIFRSFPYYADTRIGFSATYSCYKHGSTVVFEIYVYDGVSALWGVVFIDHRSGDVTYLDDTGAYAPLCSLGQLGESGEIWYPTKLVIDAGTHEYVGLYHGSTYQSMAGLALYAYASVQAAHVVAGLSLHAASATEHILYVDSAVYTVNEY